MRRWMRCFGAVTGSNVGWECSDATGPALELVLLGTCSPPEPEVSPVTASVPSFPLGPCLLSAKIMRAILTFTFLIIYVAALRQYKQYADSG